MKNNVMKLIIPALIVVVVLCLWLFKTHEEQSEAVARHNRLVHARQGAASLQMNPAFDLRETEAIDFKALAQYDLPIIVDYGADTCIPCKEMAPVWKRQTKSFILRCSPLVQRSHL